MPVDKLQVKAAEMLPHVGLARSKHDLTNCGTVRSYSTGGQAEQHQSCTTKFSYRKRVGKYKCWRPYKAYGQHTRVDSVLSHFVRLCTRASAATSAGPTVVCSLSLMSQLLACTPCTPLSSKMGLQCYPYRPRKGPGIFPRIREVPKEDDSPLRASVEIHSLAGRCTRGRPSRRPCGQIRHSGFS